MSPIAQSGLLSGMLLLRNADVHAPEHLGRQSLLTGGGKILWTGPGAELPELPPALRQQVQMIDLEGRRLVPGLIDGHVHVTGGGGEAGQDARPARAALALHELLATVYALREEGLNAYAFVGGYHLPPATLTGSVRSDLVLIEALEQSEIPARVFNPTRVNRRRALFDEALALERKGCSIDLTAFPVDEGEDAYTAAEALRRYLESGAPPDRVTVSSDAGGCLPCFDSEGRVCSMDVGSAGSLLATVRELVAGGIPLETALPAFTRNPARLLRLAGKGEIVAGADADLVALDETGAAHTVIIRGEVHLRGGAAVRRGTFEN